MKSMRNLAIDAALGVATLLLAWYFCWLPYRCNITRRAVRPSTERAYISSRGDMQGRIVGRANLEALRKCAMSPCRTVSGLMLVAANRQIVDDYIGAAQTYRAALALDRRPEIYLNLGNALARAGDRRAAAENLRRAVLFNPWTMLNIEDGQLREETFRYLLETRPSSEKLYRYIYQLPPDAV